MDSSETPSPFPLEEFAPAEELIALLEINSLSLVFVLPLQLLDDLAFLKQTVRGDL